MEPSTVKLIECPRDAMQGLTHIIPTEEKVAYLNSLLRVGFHTLDAGSFVSAKAIPQMADTAEVFDRLDLNGSSTRVLAIIANLRGAQQAAGFNAVTYLGFPFSISETFQQRNTNSSITQSYERLKEIMDLCVARGKELMVYLSMGFGNPYGDPYSPRLVNEWAGRIAELGVKIISIADTVGLATPALVQQVTASAIQAMPGIEIGVHLHSSPFNWQEKFKGAWNAGCRRFDGAINGIGGCPMAGDELVGNMDTLQIIRELEHTGNKLSIDHEALDHSTSIATQLFT